MENYLSKQTFATFKQELNEKNEREFYDYFIEGDGITSYIIEGLGDNIILSENQLIEMLSQSKVEFEFIDTYKEFSHLIFNNIPITIRVM